MSELTERLKNPLAVLTRSDLRELGWSRRAVDAIFLVCPVIVVPGFSRPVIRARDYLAAVERWTYEKDRVRNVA